MSTTSHAKFELELAGFFDEDSDYAGAIGGGGYGINGSLRKNKDTQVVQHRL